MNDDPGLRKKFEELIVPVESEPQPLGEYVARMRDYFDDLLVRVEGVQLTTDEEYVALTAYLTAQMYEYFQSQRQELDVGEVLILGPDTHFMVYDPDGKVNCVLRVMVGAKVYGIVKTLSVVERLDENGMPVIQRQHSTKGLSFEELEKMFSLALVFRHADVIGENGKHRVFPDEANVTVPFHYSKQRIHKVSQ